MGYSDDKTNAELLVLEKRIKREYKKAYEEMAETAEAYFAKFKERYQKEYEAFQEGKYTRTQFDAWVETQIARGKAWEAKRDQLANIMTKANQMASELINGATPSVYALNANYTAWEVSQVYPSSNFATSFDLVSADTVSNLLQDKGNYTDFKTVRVNPKRDYTWNTKQIQSALTSGILQGKSIDKLADSFMVVQKRNRNAAVRNARTAVTSAQNSGRISSMKRAQDMGIEVKKKWLSASDNRVRDSHAHLNGQIRDIDETFDNDLLYPGDSNGIPAEVYNCRCTLTYIYPKYQNVESNEEYSEDKNKSESYQQWVKRKKAEQNILEEENGKKTMRAKIEDATTRALQFTNGLTAQQAGYNKLSDLPIIAKKESVKASATAVNPRHDSFLSKSRLSYAYTKNCQRCVVAFEMRQRGFDVQAGARIANEVDTQKTFKKGVLNKRSWVKAFRNVEQQDFLMVGESGDAKQTVSKIESFMKEAGAGSRGIIKIRHVSGAGHVFSVVNDGGNIRYIDSQLGGEYTDIQGYFENAIVINKTALLRTDNLELSHKALSLIEVAE